MSWIEITLIVAAVAVPIVTLFLILPKKKNKTEDKSAEKPKENVVAEKPAEKKESSVMTEQNKDAKTQPLFDSVDYKAEDFKDYLKEKSKSSNRPKRKTMNDDYKDLSQGLDSFMRAQVSPKKSLADDICCLSPEVQAMIFAGLLDKKF